MKKQVLVVRKDLGMRKGKMIAQGAHASLKSILDQGAVVKFPKAGPFGKIIHATIAFWICLKSIFSKSRTEGFLVIPLTPELKGWLYDGLFTKITVGVDSEKELLNIYQKAQQKGLINSLIQDAGKTEFGGIPTYTVVAVGPAEEHAVNEITGSLKLL